ncbi:eukaryotic translation initiation factor 3 subunit B-like isoform X2 [Prunus yedoensis var. nudiflora]|uniref:Eukaryotic translation initiation factor 3 subunit B-like isoform X2 n=1 Tax=Prunus yedoensis var. nudiflora TaxID=2094558 RepID=A0A314Y674_PRUYE|nr:eukaryotic translation initiation factor 3 subunit B-like isoform X2 [Prunus yedoensis var. nudiflora]
MTIDTATMEDIQAKAEKLRLQLSSLHFNSAAPPPNQDLYNNNTENNFGDGQEVFYDDDGLLFNIGFGNVIVVDNVSIVKAEMAQQLESEIRRVFSEVGVIKEDGISMPLNPLNQKTLGRCFIEFSSRQEAELARVKRDGYNFNTQALSVTLYETWTGSLISLMWGQHQKLIHPLVWYSGPPSLLSPLKEEDEVPGEERQEDQGRELGQPKEQDLGEVTASMGVMGFGGE